MTSSPDDDPPHPGGGRLCRFLVEGFDSGDALLRVLGVFSVQQVRLVQVGFDSCDDGFRARLEVAGLGAQRADHLRRRLAELPCVRSVSHDRWS